MNQETPYAGGKPGTTKRGGTKEGGGRETKIYGRDGRLEAQDDERAREKMIERVPHRFLFGASPPRGIDGLSYVSLDLLATLSYARPARASQA